MLHDATSSDNLILGPMTTSPPYTGIDRRDPRIDLLRGLSLMMIFVDHIPFDALNRLTLRSFGFSDAAEIFVFLAGYSAWMAYADLFVRQGWLAGLRKISRRCLVIWGAHALLLCGTAAILLLRFRLTGQMSADLAPLIGDGIPGLARGLTLQALPAYLDILPLYIVLLASFPIVVAGLRRHIGASLLASLAIYLVALLNGWNLPNQIDPRSAATVWTFNPFTWQFIFVLGAAAACGRCRGWRWFTELPTSLVAASVAVLVFAFLAADAWNQWPAVAASVFPRWALDHNWKTCAAPWRIIHSLALICLLLNGNWLRRIAGLPRLRPMLACGRNSLAIFSAGCILALLGRIVFEDVGLSLLTQVVVNSLGLALQVGLGGWLEERRSSRRTVSWTSWVGAEGRA